MAETRYIDLHREALVVDTHCDTLQCLYPRRTNPMTPHRSDLGLGQRARIGHVDIPRLIEGGVDCQVFAIGAAREIFPANAVRTALRLIDIFYRECEKNSDRIMPVFSYQDVVEARSKGKLAAMLSVEGGEVIEGDPGLLRMLHRLGIRMFSLVYHRSELADGALESVTPFRPNRTEGRLTSLGVEILEELQRLGIIIDVSHINDAGFWDLVEIVKKPLIASHSSCRALCDHPRNLTDEQIKAIADKDGVIGVNFAPSFIDPIKATVQRVVDHIDHIVNLVGADHAGLGSDFDGIRSTPQGLEDATCMPNITKELVDRGYSAGAVRKVLGANHLRIFKQVIG